MPVSKTQREARTLRGLWRAQKRYWRDRRELRVENKRLEGHGERERIREFWNWVGEDHANHPNNPNRRYRPMTELEVWDAGRR